MAVKTTDQPIFDAILAEPGYEYVRSLFGGLSDDTPKSERDTEVIPAVPAIDARTGSTRAPNGRFLPRHHTPEES